MLAATIKATVDDRVGKAKAEFADISSQEIHKCSDARHLRTTVKRVKELTKVANSAVTSQGIIYV